MTFEEALKLAGEINDRLGWSAEIEAGEGYCDIAARFEVAGLIYNAEIDDPAQWPVHLARISTWITQRGQTRGY